MRSSCHAALLLLLSALVSTAVAATPCDKGANSPLCLEQGWSDAQRQSFYFTTQGSQLMPYSWFVALDRPVGGERFVSDGLSRFGYLPGTRHKKLNPDGLPVGFVMDVDKRGVWVGMTCAACHTNEIRYRGTTLRVDGAPTGADMHAFLSELRAAIARLVTDDGAFKRFAARLPEGKKGETALKALRADVVKFSDYFDTLLRDSTPDVAWGPSRLDAFGMIFNRVSSIDLGIPGNSLKPNAPVSYPFLWGTSWHNVVQWNGSAPNEFELERLARNVGEVLGVFAKVDLDLRAGLYYPSTVRRIRLLNLEATASDLKAPPWPAELFGALDPERVKRGEELFRSRCIECHSVVPREDQKRRVTVKMTDLAIVGTDPAMARAAAERTSDTGRLAGTRRNILFGPVLGEKTRTLNILTNAVTGVILAPPIATYRDPDFSSLITPENLTVRGTLTNLTESEKTLVGSSLKELQSERDDTVERLNAKQDAANLMAYKGRPLNGIWATAPYLHNGSVPNLNQLLLPPGERDTTFHVGSREFDPINVGFDIAPSPDTFEFKTDIDGNRNGGHVYGTDAKPEDRRNLLEYLKSL